MISFHVHIITSPVTCSCTTYNKKLETRLLFIGVKMGDFPRSVPKRKNTPTKSITIPYLLFAIILQKKIDG